MPLQEVPFRLEEQVQRLRGRRTELVVGEAGDRTDTTLAELVMQWKEQPGVAAHWSERAAAASQGAFTVFGERWPTTDEGVPEWDLDPLTGYRWPQDYCFDVPLAPKASRPVEVKYVWELNRLLYLLPIAAHSATQGDAESRQLCRAHLESWIRSHPPRRGVTWRSGIELAHRILVFVLVLEMTNSGSDADASLEHLVSREVADHVDWIRRFPSRFSSANNHRVTELVALLIAASAYPATTGVDDVRAWFEELDAVALLQFHADGGPAEQATMYALQVLEWITIGLRLAGLHGYTFSDATQERMGAAAHFLASVTDAAGHTVRIGDDDDSRLLTAALQPEDLPRAVLQLAADALDVPLPQAQAGLSTFVLGGYSAWRSETHEPEILWVLDHGPLGMGHLAAHAHADTLAIFLHVGGRPVLVDAGTYLYHSGGAWRDRLRRTGEHNTVAVGGQDSSVMAGPFSWRRSPRAQGRLISATSSAADWSVEAEHHGYADRFSVVHRRRLEGTGPRTFRLTDHLDGATRDTPFRWSMLAAPGLDVVVGNEGCVISDDGTDILTLTFPAGWRGSITSEPAWHSPAFGHLERTVRIVVEGSVGQGFPLSVGITVHGAGSSPV